VERKGKTRAAGRWGGEFDYPISPLEYLDGQAVAEGDLFPLESMSLQGETGVAGFSRSRSGVSSLLSVLTSVDAAAAVGREGHRVGHVTASRIIGLNASLHLLEEQFFYNASTR
jgi:hypothetical protein